MKWVYRLFKHFLSVARMFRGYEISENLQDFKTSCLFVNDCDADNIKANSFVANCKNLPNGLTAGYIEVIWSEATSVKIQRFTGRRHYYRRRGAGDC